MRINSKDQLQGVPMTHIRDFLQRESGYPWSEENFSRSLNLDILKAESLIAELERLDFIEPLEDGDGQKLWYSTIKGNALAQATAAKAILRKTADRLIYEFLERVVSLNDDPKYAYQVDRVVLFGSYLSGVDRINDIDIIVYLAPRESDPERHEEVRRQRIREGVSSGRCSPDVYECAAWPQTEVYEYLRAHKRAISIHPDLDFEVAMKSGKYREIYPAPVAGT